MVAPGLSGNCALGLIMMDPAACAPSRNLMRAYARPAHRPARRAAEQVRIGGGARPPRPRDRREACVKVQRRHADATRRDRWPSAHSARWGPWIAWLAGPMRGSLGKTRFNEIESTDDVGRWTLLTGEPCLRFTYPCYASGYVLRAVKIWGQGCTPLPALKVQDFSDQTCPGLWWNHRTMTTPKPDCPRTHSSSSRFATRRS